MAIYFGIDSNYANTLFSSLNTSNSSSSGLSSLLGDYSSIKNGSYGKLLDKYYSLNSDSSKSDSTSASTSTSNDSTKVLTSIKTSTDELKDSADALIKSGTDSVFNKITKTDEGGNTTREYDKDKIYASVKSFVEDYNDVIKTTADSNTSSIASNSKAMINTTIANRSLLSKIGISMEKDGTLSIDEDQFKSADMTTAKSLFNGAGSYGYQISAKASMLNYNAQTESSKANTYTNNGGYSNNFSTGDIYNSLF